MGLIDYLTNKSMLKKLRNRALEIDALKDKIALLSDEELVSKTRYFQSLFNNVDSIEKEKKILDRITNEAFAVCREAAKRVLNQFPYLVQIMGALVINDGDIAEMKTGEGKTLTATMAVYANALTGRGVHVITVNEYLAERDANWMGEIYRFLGLTVGCNLQQLNSKAKREVYSCDITYTTNSELGFDYLRDNLVTNIEDKVQVKGLNFCIIDECDSILIDDAKTPLIISGGNGQNMAIYMPCQLFVEALAKNYDYEINEQSKTVYLTTSGTQKAEKMFNVENLFDIKNQNLLHCINNALKANYVMKNNVDYVIKKNEIEIVDQNTGRVLTGRSYSDGLHQAIQAKERVTIKPEMVTFATITYQNFFRLYNKLSGMTGTAKTEEDEFISTYNMRVIEIPTNKPVIRIDNIDQVYATKELKYEAIINEIITRHKTGQPILLGTISVETSNLLYNRIKQKGLKAELLNAINDEREAEIIKNAGQIGAITIATNMAGRGTDIKLDEGVKELGGLCVLGSERHDAKRIDNQLRGRSGRQGDIGFSQFYVSLEDDLLIRDSNSKFIKQAHNKTEKIESSLVYSNIDKAQSAIESINYYSRKQLLDYDNVLSQQRQTIYKIRDQILASKDLMDIVLKYVNVLATFYIESQMINNVNSFEKISEFFSKELLIEYNIDSKIINMLDSKNDYKKYLEETIISLINEKKLQIDETTFTNILNIILLRTIDNNWPAHITKMQNLKEGVFYRQYANVNPLDVYKNEGYQMFNEMLISIAKQVIMTIVKLQITTNDSSNNDN